jgi:hypothetical protein
MAGSWKNTYCIQVWKNNNLKDTKVLKRINKNGTAVLTKKYSEVFFYTNLQEAMPDARLLMEKGYDIKIRKCCEGNNDTLWLI